MEKKVITESALIERAVKAMKNTYSPYSHFAVGAALLTKKGKVYIGTNVENSSFGLTICAERSAIVSAISNGENEFQTLVVASNTNPPASPCGACRQFLIEFGDFTVILVNPLGTEVRTTVKELLPLYFLLDRSVEPVK
jgi:cytidine deaminase